MCFCVWEHNHEAVVATELSALVFHFKAGGLALKVALVSQNAPEMFKNPKLSWGAYHQIPITHLPVVNVMPSHQGWNFEWSGQSDCEEIIAWVCSQVNCMHNYSI